MKAKELYRILDGELRPYMTERGFKKTKASRLTYQRNVEGKYQSVWFQCDNWGWDAYAGSKFYVNFTVSRTENVEGVVRRDERLNYFLTDGELDRAREFRDEIVANIPKPPDSYFKDMRTAFSKAVGKESAISLIWTIRNQFEPEEIPYRRNGDFALRYFQPGDVTGWAAFILSVLPRAIEQMQSWSFSRSS